jgi:signal transduction histidine kinase
MQTYRTIFERAIAIFFLMIALSGQCLTLDKNDNLHRLSSEIMLLEDPSGQKGFAEISSPEMQRQFRPWSKPGDINLGFSQSAYWLKFTIARTEDAPANWAVEIPYLSVEMIDFYSPEQPPILTGSAKPFSTRPVAHRFFLFPVTATTEPRDYYIRIKSQYGLTVPINVWKPKAFYEDAQKTLTIQALYFGGLLALLIYNLFLWLSLKDPRFLFYSLFCSFLGMGNFAGNGFGRLFIWPDAASFDVISMTLLLSTSLVFAIEFAITFLRSKEVAPRTTMVMRATQLAAVTVALLLLCSLWVDIPTFWVYQLFILTTMLATPLILWTGVCAWRAKVAGARFFMLAWCILLGGGFIASLRLLGLLQANIFTSYSVQIASAFEMLLLALALADTVRHERDERERAQRQALISSEQLIKMTKESEQNLEQAVAERTEQLKISLANEKAVMSQFVRFGSLISHEFRNPLGVIDSQIALMRKELVIGNSNQSGRLDTISGATQRLVKMFDKWLADGQARPDIRVMQKSLFTISQWLPQFLHENRMLLEQRRIDTRLDHTVIELYADKELLDIALLNLLDNACKYSDTGSTITIATHKKPGFVGISVLDFGKGIAAEHHEQVFDEYFRIPADEDARGTGLGLPFVKSILSNHGGHIDLQSKPDQGSIFTLWFPEFEEVKK